MAITILGDIHFKTEPKPFHDGLMQLFHEYLIPNHGMNKLILTGDVLDSASKVRWEMYNEVINIFQKFNEVHIVVGNHDFSDTVGNALKPFTKLSNVQIYEKETEVVIDGLKFLFLPHQNLEYMQKTYTDYEWQGDYVVTHIAPPNTNFGIGEITLNNIKVSRAIIHGHIHNYSEFVDHNSNVNIILGVPQTTRNLEQSFQKQLLNIDQDGSFYLSYLPEYYTIEDIQYGEFPSNKNNLLNILNAPSKKSVIDMYKDYNLRMEGIQCIISEELPISLTDLQDRNSSLLEAKVSKFYIEKQVDNDMQNCINSYLLKVIQDSKERVV